MKKLLIIFSILILIPNTVLAQKISYLGIENEIVGNTVNTKLDITFSVPNEERFVFPVYATLSNLEYTSNFDSECFSEKRTYGTDIICSLNSLTSEKRSLKINFTSLGLIAKDGSQYVFSNDVFIPSEVSAFFYQVTLPPGSGLAQGNDISPEGWETASPDGRRILLFWNKGKLLGGQTFSANFVYESVSVVIGIPLGPRTQIFVLGGIVAAVAVGILLWRRRSMISFVLPILKDDEKRIFEALMKHGSGTHQRMIVKESNYSKAKAAKGLKGLEQR